jgi:hypothetical protein
MKKIKKNKTQKNTILVLNELSDFFYKIQDSKIDIIDNTNLTFEKNNMFAAFFIDEAKLKVHMFEEDNSIIDSVDIMELIEARLIKETQFIKNAEEEGIKLKYFYKRRNSVNDSRKSQIIVFTMDENFIKEEYSQIATDINYIDLITPMSMFPEVLYESEILEKEKTDIYIYFGIDKSFISIFNAGKYIYSKDIQVSLKDIYEKLSKKLEQRIEFDEFKNLLINRGFNIEAYEADDMNILDLLINDIFHEIFNKINNITTSARRMLAIEKVDRVFIGTEVGSIPEMKEYATEKISYAKVLNFSFTEHTTLNIELKDKINPIIELLNIYLSIKDKSEILNFTEFKQPLPFFKRPTAPIISIAMLGIAGIAIFAISQILYLQSLKSKVKNLESKNKIFKISLAETEAYKKKILGEKKKLIDEEKNLQRKLSKEIEHLKKLKLQIVNNESKTGYFINIFKELTKLGIKLKTFKVNNGKEINLIIETKKHLNIGIFVNNILKTELYEVKIGEIKLNPSTGYYSTSITLKRKGN